MKQLFQWKWILVLGVILAVGLGYRQWFAPAKSGTFHLIGQWGEKGSGPGQFNEPIGISVDSQGFVYVADARNARIQKFDSQGRFLLEWGSYGQEAGEFEKPVGIAASPTGEVYVSDYDLDRIQVFDLQGNFRRQWGETGDGKTQFSAPAEIGVGPKGNVLVADFYNHRVQEFHADGTFQRIIGSSGRFWSGDFHYPTDVFVDTEGNLFIADAYNYRVQKFLPDGRFCHKWGGPFGWGLPGKWPGWFRVPSGVAKDPSRNLLFVADSANHRIVGMTTKGKYLNAWSLMDNQHPEMYSPTRVAVGNDGMIYAVDTANHRVILLQFHLDEK